MAEEADSLNRLVRVGDFLDFLLTDRLLDRGESLDEVFERPRIPVHGVRKELQVPRLHFRQLVLVPVYDLLDLF